MRNWQIADRGDLADSVLDLLERDARPAEEALSCHGERDPGVMAMEQGSAEIVFEIADTAAHRRLFDVQVLRCFTKATVLRGDDKIVDMTKLDHDGATFLRVYRS